MKKQEPVPVKSKRGQTTANASDIADSIRKAAKAKRARERLDVLGNHPPEDDDEEAGGLNEDGLDAILDEASEIRHHLNEELWADYRTQQKLFKALFKEQGSSLKLLVDLIHYQGGYPSPNSPPKHESLGRRFGQAYRVLWNVGRQEDLNQHLEAFGLKIVVTDPSKLEMPLRHQSAPDKLVTWCKERKRKVPKVWKNRQVLQWFIDYCDALQTNICQQANIIKHELYPKAAKMVSDLAKGDFRETVGLRYRTKLVNSLPGDEEDADPHVLAELGGSTRKKKLARRHQSIVKRLKSGQNRAEALKVSLKVSTKGLQDPTQV